MSGVPTLGEEQLSATLEEVQRTGIAHCNLCDEAVDVSDADNWGDVFEALAWHGEERDDHVWASDGGWRLAEGEDMRGDAGE